MTGHDHTTRDREQMAIDGSLLAKHLQHTHGLPHERLMTDTNWQETHQLLHAAKLLEEKVTEHIAAPHTATQLVANMHSHLRDEHGVTDEQLTEARSFRELHTEIHARHALNSPTNDGSYRVTNLGELRQVMAELEDLDDATPVTAQAEAGQVHVDRVDIGVYNVGIIIDLDT